LADNDDKEETAIGVYWVTDGIDSRCLVGFLPRSCVKKNSHIYNGRVAQVVEFLSTSESPSSQKKSQAKRGVCMAALLQSITQQN
jgi:hypothetical protein